jgi:hypothetical protein
MSTAREAQQSKAKGCMIACAVLVIVVASLAHVITITETTPDRAKFVYDIRLNIIVPCPQIGQPAFYPVPGKFSDVRDSLSSEWDGVTTWAEIRRKDGPFSQFNRPKGQGWDNFVLYERPIPLWQTLIFRPESRWDEEGYWRY